MTVKERWINSPKADWLVAASGLGLLLVPIPKGAFYAMATTVGTTAGVLLGMGAVVYGLFQQASSERIKVVRVAYRSELRANWLAVHSGFVVACALALLSVAAWVAYRPAGISMLGVALALMLVRAARMGWLLRLYLKVDEADSVPTLTLRSDIAKR